jgi:hypothetical protein
MADLIKLQSNIQLLQDLVSRLVFINKENAYVLKVEIEVNHVN